MMRKRKHVRFEDPSSVHVKLYAVSGQEDMTGAILHCHTRDISEGGIALTMNRELPVNTPIKLRIAVNDPPSSFTHHAEVRWTKKQDSGDTFNAGLEFVEASETHMDEWRRLIRYISVSERTTGVAQES